MSSFSRFQDINQKRGIANQYTNGGFIMKGYSSIFITNAQTGEELAASVVNRQEKDLAYIYTHLEKPLEIGSVWGAKGLNWLISEEIVIIKDVKWHKYTAFLCNVEVNGLWGYFISPEKKHISVAIREEVLLESQQKPILVLGQDALQIGDKFLIKDRAWMVQEKDNLSTDGVVYYSLVATTIATDKTYQSTQETQLQPQIKESSLYNGTFTPETEIVFATENGVFNTNSSAVKILSLDEKEVVFIIPFGVDEVEITIQENEQLQTYLLRKEL